MGLTRRVGAPAAAAPRGGGAPPHTRVSRPPPPGRLLLRAPRPHERGGRRGGDGWRGCGLLRRVAAPGARGLGGRGAGRAAAPLRADGAEAAGCGAWAGWPAAAAAAGADPGAGAWRLGRSPAPPRRVLGGLVPARADSRRANGHG